MKKTLTVLVFLLALGGISYAQQDAMFTKYMFNSLVFNPGYAGSKDYMSVGLLHRTQWYDFQGAPTTQSFTIHTPLKNERVGVGLSLVNDQIGPTNSLGVNISYAYRIPIGKSKLAIGLQGGMENYRADWTQVGLAEPDDIAFGMPMNVWNPNFGAGVYFYNKRFYAGFSVPHLVEYDLSPDENQNQFYARDYRHFYFTTGLAIPIKGDNLIFKPSILIKNVGLDKALSKDPVYTNIGAPTAFDIDLSLLFYEKFWVGGSFRSSVGAFQKGPDGEPLSSFDSVDLWFSWNMPNGLRLGMAYDYPLTVINTQTAGSLEIMMGYEFNYVTKATVTPRYF